MGKVSLIRCSLTLSLTLIALSGILASGAQGRQIAGAQTVSPTSARVQLLAKFRPQVSGNAVAFSRDGHLIALGNASWDGPRLVEVAGIERYLQPSMEAFGTCSLVNSVAFSPDGSALAEAELHRVTFWDLSTGVVSGKLDPPSGHELMALAWSPDGSTIAAGTQFTDHAVPTATRRVLRAAGDVVLWDASSGVLQRALQRDGNRVLSLQFSPDGQYLAVLTASWGDVRTEELTLYRWRGGKPAYRSKMTQVVGRIVVSWGLGTNSCCIAWLPNSKRIVTVGYDTCIRIWEIPEPVAPMTDIDVPDLKLSQTIQSSLPSSTGGVQSVAVSSDGQLMVTGHPDDTVKLWLPNTGQLIHSFKAYGGHVSSVALSPDGKILATASPVDKTRYLWSIDLASAEK